MISLFSGTPGSGKSLHVAERIYSNNLMGRPIIANFPIKTEKLRNPELFWYIDNQELTPDYLANFSYEYFENEKFGEGKILLIIDEAQLVFNVREWNLKGRDKWIHFFTQHRKLGFNVIVVAQFDRMIDKQLRSLFEYEFIHRKLSNFGIKGKIFSAFTGGRLFIAVQRWYPLKERVGSQFFLYKKKWGDLYDTTMLFEKPSGKSKEVSVATDNSQGDFLEFVNY